MKTLPDLFGEFPQPGRIEWIGVRPQDGGRPVAVADVRAIVGVGLQGDHYGGGARGKRHVTLIQQEHLAVVAKLLALRDGIVVPVPIDPSIVHKQRYSPEMATANPSAGTWSASRGPRSTPSPSSAFPRCGWWGRAR